MLFSEISIVRNGETWKLQRKLSNGSSVDLSPLELALAAALQVSRESSQLHIACRCARGIDGRAHSPDYNLPRVLQAANRVGAKIAHLASCLAVSEVREQLNDANRAGVQFAAEVANSYTEAIYQAAERQYLLVSMFCRHGVEFDYRSRLHPAEQQQLATPWAELPSINEITYDPDTGGYLRSPAMLLNRIVQQIIAVPEIVPDQVSVLLEKEYQRAMGGNRRDQPSWNGMELSFRGQVVRTVSGQAKNLKTVLGAFQELNWPARIDDPLPGGKDSARVNDTVKSLNEGLIGLKFSAYGGNSFSWQATHGNN